MGESKIAWKTNPGLQEFTAQTTLVSAAKAAELSRVAVVGVGGQGPKVSGLKEPEKRTKRPRSALGKTPKIGFKQHSNCPSKKWSCKGLKQGVQPERGVETGIPNMSTNIVLIHVESPITL